MEGGENHEPPKFCIEVYASKGGRKLAVLRLHHCATLQSAVEATVDLAKHCSIKLFSDMNMFSIVLYEKYNFLTGLQLYFYEIH